MVIIYFIEKKKKMELDCNFLPLVFIAFYYIIFFSSDNSMQKEKSKNNANY